MQYAGLGSTGCIRNLGALAVRILDEFRLIEYTNKNKEYLQ